MEKASKSPLTEHLDRCCVHHNIDLRGYRVTKHGSTQTCLCHLVIMLLPPHWDRYPQDPKLPSQLFCLEEMTLYLTKGR